MIYCTPMSGSYFLYGSILEKCGNFWKNGRFSGRIWPDWGNTARADMAGLGSIGLSRIKLRLVTVKGLISCSLNHSIVNGINLLNIDPSA